MKIECRLPQHPEWCYTIVRDCRDENFRLIDEFASDIDVGNLGADGIRGDGDTFDHHVWIDENQFPVFEGPGLRFVGVADEIRWFGRILGYESPFHSGRESGAATTSDTRCLDLFDDLSGFHRQCLGQGSVSTAF